jgi:hypothetical protein
MKNLSRKDDLGFTGQGMGETMITDYENRGGEVWQRHADGRRELFAADIIEKLTGLERELNQAIRERDQARSNVKPMGAVTIARNGYIQEIEAHRDQAIKERDQAQSALQTLIVLHQREIEKGEPITGEDWEIAGYAITEKKP